MFNGFHITNKGQAYIAKALAGGTLTITKGRYGNGVLAVGEDPCARINLKAALADMPIFARHTEGETLTIKTQFSNVEDGTIIPAFHLTEAGIFGRIEDEPDYPETLLFYAYTPKETADYVQATLTEFTLEWPIEMAGEANVEVVINESLACPSIKAFNVLRDAAYAGYATDTGNYYCGQSGEGGISAHRIEGRSIQNKTLGYNLIGLPDVAETTNNGITYSIIDQTLSLNGTWEGTGTLGMGRLLGIIEDAGPYVLKLSPISGTWTDGGIGIRNVSDGNQIMYHQISSEKNFNTKEYTADMIDPAGTLSLYATAGATFSNFKCQLMLTAGSDTTKEYEPYTGGIPAPNPSYPMATSDVQINKFESRGRNWMKNTLEYEWVENGATKEIIDDYIKVIMPDEPKRWSGIYCQPTGGTHISETLAILKGRTCTYSFMAKADSTRTIYYQIGDAAERYITLTTEWKRYSVTIPSMGTQVPTFYCGTTFSTVNYYIKDIMLESGGEVHDWEEYKTDETPLAASLVLRSLPDGVRDNYEDGNIIRRVGVITFDGSETWAINDGFTTDEYAAFYYKPEDRKERSYAVCDRFETRLYVDCLIGGALAVEALRYDSSAIYFFIKTERLSTVDVDGFKAWLAENKPEVYYELAEEVIEGFSIPTITSWDNYTNAWHDSEIEPQEIVWHTNLGGKETYAKNEIDEMFENVDEMKFFGWNPEVAEDTTAEWKKYGTGYAYFNTESTIINKPSPYGIMIQRVVSNIVEQTWYRVSVTRVFTRIGDSTGWENSADKNGADAWSELVSSPGARKTIWSGTWSEGSITVPYARNYSLFIVYLSGLSTPILLARYGTETPVLRGISANALVDNMITFQVSISVDDGDVWTLTACTAMYHTPSGNHGNLVNYSITTIIGII